MALEQKQDDGATLRTHLERLRNSTGKTDERLVIEWPVAGWALWIAFTRLANVSYTEIDAYTRLHGIRLTAWELEILHLFDRLAHEASTTGAPA